MSYNVEIFLSTKVAGPLRDQTDTGVKFITFLGDDYLHMHGRILPKKA